MTKCRLLNRVISQLIHIALLAVVFVPPFTEAARLNDIRVWHAPDHTRIVVDLDKSPQFKHFFLADPARFVLDLPGFALDARAPEKAKSGPYLNGIRLGQPNPKTARIVLDLKEKVRIKTLILAPVQGFGHRLVLDVYPRQTGLNVAGKPQKPIQSTAPRAAPVPETRSEPVKKNDGLITIAIDAGHGGEDSGARGRKTYEKDIVLQIAKRLQKKINAQKGMKSILTRKGDYFLSLRDRTRIAREAGADLFISIHADGFKNGNARGSSVYALSLSGASSETARWLADKENSADLAGGVNISERDDTLAKVLLSLAMQSTQNESIPFASAVLRELKKIGKVHNPAVEKAGFVVLKSPDIPSILVETAYITNRTEEKLLRSASHQEKLANAILTGTRNYLKGSSYHTASGSNNS